MKSNEIVKILIVVKKIKLIYSTDYLKLIMLINSSYIEGEKEWRKEGIDHSINF